jgi:hypothetical protein
VPGHHPDRDTQPGQVHGESTADLADPEHDVPILTHGQVLSLTLKQPGHRRQPGLDVCHSRYASTRKQAMDFKNR